MAEDFKLARSILAMPFSYPLLFLYRLAFPSRLWAQDDFPIVLSVGYAAFSNFKASRSYNMAGERKTLQK
jgi:hypothetical protein